MGMTDPVRSGRSASKEPSRVNTEDSDVEFTNLDTLAAQEYSSRPIEQTLSEEIEHFERLAALPRPPSSGEVPPGLADAAYNTNELYRAFAKRRRQLLAALRDGQPEAWRDYPG